MKVSIIIPTYNRADLLPETLDSILAQDDNSWECLLIDDESTDDTWKVIHNYSLKDTRFKIFKRKDFNKSKGANSCRNIGIEKSIGDFILFFDSDDILNKSYISSVIDNLKITKNDLIIYQSVYFFDNKTIEGNIVKISNEELLVSTFFKKKTIWLTPNPLVKKDFIINNNLSFNEDLLAAQDWEFFMKILLLNPNIEFELSLEPLIKIRKHINSISHIPKFQAQKYYYYYKARFVIYNTYLSSKQKTELKDYYQQYVQRILHELIKMKKYSWAKEIIKDNTYGIKKVFNYCLLLLYKYTSKGLSKILIS